jgi:hypothetical protein
VTEETLAHNRKAEKEYRGLFTKAKTFRRNICERKERLSLEGSPRFLSRQEGRISTSTAPPGKKNEARAFA